MEKIRDVCTAVTKTQTVPVVLTEKKLLKKLLFNGVSWAVPSARRQEHPTQGPLSGRAFLPLRRASRSSVQGRSSACTMRPELTVSSVASEEQLDQRAKRNFSRTKSSCCRNPLVSRFESSARKRHPVRRAAAAPSPSVLPCLSLTPHLTHTLSPSLHLFVSLSLSHSLTNLAHTLSHSLDLSFRRGMKGPRAGSRALL